MGERYTLPAGIWNSVMSVSHFSLGTAAWKSRLMRFSGAGLISPRYDAYLRFLGFGTTRLSCFINRCTTFSEIAQRAQHENINGELVCPFSPAALETKDPPVVHPSEPLIDRSGSDRIEFVY